MGFVFLIVSILGGFLYPYFAILFLVLSVLYGMMLSQLASGIESFLLSRYPRLSDKLLLLLAAFLEFFGYRQLLTIERFLAFFQVWRKRGHWGTMKRRVVTQPAPTKAR